MCADHRCAVQGGSGLGLKVKKVLLGTRFTYVLKRIDEKFAGTTCAALLPRGHAALLRPTAAAAAAGYLQVGDTLLTINGIPLGAETSVKDALEEIRVRPDPLHAVPSQAPFSGRVRGRAVLIPRLAGHERGRGGRHNADVDRGGSGGRGRRCSQRRRRRRAPRAWGRLDQVNVIAHQPRRHQPRR